MNRLKPCPFCGSNAIVIANNYRHNQTTFCVKCNNDDCKVIPVTYEHSAMNDAIEAWNRRTNFATDNNVGDKWIPVTERLPKPYMDVITLRKNLFVEEYQSCGLEYITIKGIADIPTWSKDNVTWKTKVTHWMPLPEPPKGE